MKLEAKNLSCLKGDKTIFSKLSFSVASGELCAVRGHNGAGKSSLLKILTGMASPEKGAIYWNEQNIAHSIEYSEQISYLGHKDGLKKALTPRENLVHYRALAGNLKMGSPDEIFTAFGLNPVLQVPCQQLSAGQRRKVALICLLLQQKKIWFLDEPFASLDEISLNLLQTYFLQHLSQGGLIIMASHLWLQQPHQMVDLNTMRKVGC